MLSDMKPYLGRTVMGPVLAVAVQHHQVCFRLYSIEHTNISRLISLREEISADVPHYILNKWAFIGIKKVGKRLINK